MVTTAGVVLAGGRSTRMGSAKAALAWHGSTLLRRVTGLVGRAVQGPVVVVRAPGQDLPALPDQVEVAEDPVAGRGPLQGLAVGLAWLAGRAEVAFVCGTDLPFLHPAFVRRVLAELTGQVDPDGVNPRQVDPGRVDPDGVDAERPDPDRLDIVLPVARGYQQPLAAAYRTGLAPLVADLVAAGRLRPAFLFEACAVRRLADAALLADPVLAGVDPDLGSLRNLNSPADYRAALAWPAPEVTVRCVGTLAAGGRGGPRTVRAATVAEAAGVVGLALDRHVAATVCGGPVSQDGELPLAAGDTVAFLAAGPAGYAPDAGAGLTPR
jgi:molybdopterin-guanine dinucleotide biosynthesis protein A